MSTLGVSLSRHFKKRSCKWRKNTDTTNNLMQMCKTNKKHITIEEREGKENYRGE